MEALTKGQRAYLSRHACAWCEQQLHRDSCAAIFDRCDEKTRAERRAKCLAGYKPRTPTPEAPQK